MYVVMRGKQIIAAHSDREVVSQYVSEQSSRDDIRMLKVKKKKSEDLVSNEGFEDIYLVRYGDHYIPYDQYIAVKDISSQRDYDIKYCRDVLYRLIEEGVIHSKKDISATSRLVLILEKELESLDSAEYDTLESLKRDINDHNESYKYKMELED